MSTTPRNNASEKERLPLVEDDDHMHSSGTQQTLRVFVLQLRHYAFFLANVAAWYNTNGMNGISMQSFAGVVKQENTRDSLLTVAAITSVVTALQLFFGALVGCLLLCLHAVIVPSAHPLNIPSLFLFDFRESVLSALHGIGSICTNLGFMYGSASLVQIIKLLEPFETLLFTRLLLPDESKLLTVGVASSMTLTVGAAISLIQSRQTQPHPNAIAFAILSGLTLSTRNVLQRKQHSSDKPSNHQTASTSRSVVEKSLVQFTQLSWQSALVMMLLSIVLFVLLASFQTAAASESFRLTVNGMNWGILTWHPLYNAFSMITLGFCSALTHSLLNAGKRVFAIVMAIVWFKESFTRGTVLGLALVFCGGCWYTVESKAKGDDSKGQRHWMRLTKPMTSLLLLQLIHMVHEQDQIKAIP